MDTQTVIPSDLGFLGSWSWEPSTDTVRTTGRLDELFDVCPNVNGLPMGSYERHIHPHDLDWLRRERPRCFGPAGWGVIEYRMIDRDGLIRWVMCRGLYRTDANGAIVRAHGMMFDVTELRADGVSPRVAPTPLVNPLAHAADALMTAHEAAAQCGNEQLLFQIEAALVVAGKDLARRLTVTNQRASYS